MNHRRRLLAVLGVSALAAAFGSSAQQQGKVWRVGFLSYIPRPDGRDVVGILAPFVEGMRELGYVEGRNLVIEPRFADGDAERLPRLAAELVELKVDAIVCGTTQSIRAAQKATSTIPIVMLTSYDPVGDGFVKNLARPEGNITGRTNVIVEIGPKLLEMLLAVVPMLSRAAVLMNPDNLSHPAVMKSIQSAARQVSVTAWAFQARTAVEIDAAFTQMASQKVGALIVIRDAYFNNQVRRIAELATSHRLPTVGAIADFAEAGGLLSYGESRYEPSRRAAIYVDKIFKGAKPGDLPVEQPARFELVVNAKTARALGLKIPPALLIRANRTIE